MDSLGNFLQTALVVLSLASLAGYGVTRARVVDLREQLDDARKEIADKDRRHSEENTASNQRISDAEAEIIRLNAKVNSQAHDLEATGRLIRGESYWLELGEKLDGHHTAAEQHWSTDEATLQQILARLDAFTDRERP